MPLFVKTVAISGSVVLTLAGAAFAYDSLSKAHRSELKVMSQIFSWADYDSSSKADRSELRAQANAECRKPEHEADSQPRINYAQGTFYCRSTN